jgi:hypothetical protein
MTQYLYLDVEHLDTVIQSFLNEFPCNVTTEVPKSECIDIFKNMFPHDDEGLEYMITEETMKVYLDKISAIALDRAMNKLEKEDLIKTCWDSETNDVVWIRK